jgi:hypothetical protein
MSANLSTFEVEVEVITGNKRYTYYPVNSQTANKNVEPKKGVFIKDALVKLFQFENCTKDRAIDLGKKHGKVKSCRKIDAYESLLAIEKLELNQTTIYDRGCQYASPIAMDGMIWQKRKNKNVVDV